MSEVTFEEIAAAVEAGASTRRPQPPVKPRFRTGDRVRVKSEHPWHHTRSPRYARGKMGVIVRAHGVFVYPDSNSQWQGEDPQHVYTVRFSARELWGEQAAEADSLCLDLWEPYLEPA
jgi:nitrile hydratase